MNERMLELARQAKIEFTLDPTERPIRAFVECWEDELAEFAELIVRECMDIAKKVENDSFNVAGAEHEYRKGLNDGRKNAAWGIKNRMKLHFGVEE